MRTAGKGATRAKLTRVDLPDFGMPEAMPGIPDAVYAARLDRLRTRADQHGYDRLIVYADRELILSVVDEGPRSAPHQRDSSGGHGLIGMRERVLLYSGCLKTGPREQGGFAVRARLPLVAAVTGA